MKKLLPLSTLPLILLIGYALINLTAPLPYHLAQGENGVWDLRNFDFYSYNSRFDGYAPFITGALLTPEEFDLRADEAVVDSPRREPFLTSRMTILVPDGTWFTFSRPSIDYSHRVYVNGVFIKEIGSPGTSRETNIPNTGRMTFTVMPVNGVIEIVQQSSNFVHRQAGYHHTWFIGQGSALADEARATDFQASILLGSFFMLFLILLLVYVMMRGHKGTLYAALFCLMWFLRMGVTSGRVFTVLMPWLSWQAKFRIEYISIPVAAVLTLAIVNSLFPKMLHKIVLRTLYIVSSGFILIYLFADTVFMSRIILVSYAIFGLAIIYLIARFALKVRKPDMGQGIFIAGMGLFMLATLSDFIYFSFTLWFSPPFQMTGVAVLLFALCEALAVFIKTMREVDSAKEAELQLETARENSRAKSDFLAKMSHEIRTPMNAIIGMAELVLREDLSPNAQDKARTIKHSGEHLLSIINEILDFSKIESGKLEIVNGNYHFKSAVGDVCSIIQMRTQETGLEFRTSIQQNLPEALFGDEVRLRQILLNILTNALKYTKKGWFSLDVSGEMPDEDTVLLTIRVKDTGIGMKPQDLEKLFGEYAQFDLEKNRSIEGTGLGLAITQNLVKLMGGTIEVTSVYGEGSEFIVRIPQKLGDASFEEFSQPAEAFKAPDASILLVDDIETNLKVGEGLLKLFDIQAGSCTSGAAAIEDIKIKDYDLILMDHMMPEMDGIEAVEIIRGMGGKYADLPIIALTANAVVGAKEMFLQNGFNDFLSKPIEITSLTNILAKWLPKEKQQEAGTTPESVQPSPETNISIPGIDIAQGLLFSGGSYENYIDTLAIFMKDGKTKTGQLASALEASNTTLYTTYVHALKSACANIGAATLSKEAGQLEAAAIDNDLNFIATHNSPFIKKLKTLLADIEATLPTKEPTELDTSLMNAQLNKLKESIAAFDLDAIDEASEILQDFTTHPEHGTTIADILQSAFVGQYKQATLQIEEVLKNPG